VKTVNYILSILITILLMSCSGGNKPVAQYKYGIITGGDVTRRAQGIRLTPQLERSIIESLCVEGIARHDAIAEGYNRSEIFRFRVESAVIPFLKKLVNEKNRKACSLSWEYVRCRHVAFSGGRTINGRNNALIKAGKMIELLDKGINFDSLIKSYSPDPQNAVAMSTVFAVRGGGSPGFEDAAFALPEGAYNRSPVLLPDGTAVVLISDEKGTLTPGNLEKKITVPDERKRLSKMIESAVYAGVVSGMEKNNRASFNVASLPDKDNAVLFNISGKEYTLKDLLKRRDLFSTVVREPLENKSYLFGFAREWYSSELYRAEADRAGYLKDEKAAAEMKASSDFILANDYIRFVCEKEIIIPEKDMIDEYSRNRNNYMKKPEGKNKKQLHMTYNGAKVFIKKNLIRDRVAAAMDTWKKEALSGSGLVIIDQTFTGGKVMNLLAGLLKICS